MRGRRNCIGKRRNRSFTPVDCADLKRRRDDDRPEEGDERTDRESAFSAPSGESMCRDEKITNGLDCECDDEDDALVEDDDDEDDDEHEDVENDACGVEFE